MSRNEAMQKMAESLDSLVTLKIKVPLSTKTKNIHTNTWIYYEAPSDFTDKIEDIYGQMKNACKPFRYTFYRKNYWYVKGVEVSYKAGTMELTLSPMPTPYPQEKINNSSKISNTSKISDKGTKSTTKKSVDYWVDRIANQMKNEKHTYHGGRYDCFSMSHKLTCYLRKHGVTAKTIVYYSASSNSGTHRTVRYKNDKGNWVDFPYKKYGFDSLFGVTSYAKNGKEFKEGC